MKRLLLSIYDVRAELYAPPFTVKSVGEGLRAFSDLCSDKSTMPGRHPGDFKLMRLGEFDDLTGNIISDERPVSLGTGSDYVGNGNVVPIGVKSDG